MKRLMWCVAALAMFGLTACSSSTLIGGHASSNVVDQSVAPSAPTSPETAAPTQAPAGSPSARGTARQNVEIGAQGFTQLPPDAIGDSSVSYAVLISNPNDPAAARPVIASDVRLNITFTGKDGTVVASQSDTIDVVLPGQTVADADSADAKGATHMSVKVLVGDWSQNARPITGVFTTSGTKTTGDDFGIKTVGTVKSTFDKDYKELVGSAVYYNSAGKVIGGDHTFLDFIPANGTASFSISSLNELKGVARTTVYVGFSSLSLLGDG